MPNQSPSGFARKPATPEDALKPQHIKRAQLNAVWRFSALADLMGERAMRPGKALEIEPVLATPLPLLAGMGWQVDFAGSDPATLSRIGATYRLDRHSFNDTLLDLIISLDLPPLIPGETELTELRDRLAGDGRLVLSARPGSSGMTLAVLPRYARAMMRRLHAAGFKAVTLHLQNKECWIVAGGDRSDARGPSRVSLAELQAWAAVDRLGADRLPAAAFTRAWQARSTRRGGDLARHRLANARKAARLRASPVHGDRTLIHFGVHAPDNAGDLVLFETVRNTIQATPAQKWALRDVRAPVTESVIAEVNRSRGVVIGGGGLFLVDLDASSQSGWQWPCPPELLARIEKPVVVYAVGYNRFRGQDEFPAAFVESLRMLVAKAGFVGIRNHGSIAALHSYLPEELAAKLRFQPCPTTVLAHLGMAPVRRERSADAAPRLVINAAFDRFGNRLEGRIESALGGIGRLGAHAQAAGWKVIVACHSYDDEAILPFLEREGVGAQLRQLASAGTAEILDFYANVDLVAGMRGHAQMIPFGLGTPILSLIAHDKMGWFLDDIGHREWGVDVRDPEFGPRLRTVFDGLSADLPGTRERIVAARERLWDITCANTAIVRSVLDLPASA